MQMLYKGTAPALNDVVAGQVPLMFGDVVASLPLVNAGKVRALGVSSATRIPSAPEIPIIAESSVPLAKTPWYWETVTRNIALLADWGEDFSVRHLVMPNHVECCTYPVLEWIAERVPTAPVSVMAQFHPDNQFDRWAR